MNYYERMQKSIDFIEDNLAEDITVEQCAFGTSKNIIISADWEN